MRARIEDVARMAGVSTKSVSRVLNGAPYVRPSTRERILAAMRALDYRPDPSARSLASARSFEITLLYQDPAPASLLEVQAGVLEVCEAEHFSMRVRPLDAAAARSPERIAALLLEQPSAGVVLAAPLSDVDPLLDTLDALGVLHACVSPRRGIRRIGARCDEQCAVADLVAHLAALGHRRIAHIAGDAGHGSSSWRLRGFLAGMRRAGLPVRPGWVVRGRFQAQAGLSAGRRLLALRERPTAVVAGCDAIAAGVMHAASECGLSVPEQLSVCGFGDLPLAQQVWPPLTTVRQPSRELGRAAARQLLRRIAGRDTDALPSVPYELLLRGSTAGLPLEK